MEFSTPEAEGKIRIQPLKDIARFVEIKCVIADPLQAALKSVSFDTESLFMNCAPKNWVVTNVMEDITKATMKFNGLRMTDEEGAKHILKGPTGYFLIIDP